jgi:hypothetical protein
LHPSLSSRSSSPRLRSPTATSATGDDNMRSERWTCLKALEARKDTPSPNVPLPVPSSRVFHHTLRARRALTQSDNVVVVSVPDAASAETGVVERSSTGKGTFGEGVSFRASSAFKHVHLSLLMLSSPIWNTDNDHIVALSECPPRTKRVMKDA